MKFASSVKRAVAAAGFAALTLLPALAQVPPEASTSTDVEAGLTTEHLTNDYAPWQRQYLQISHRFETRKVLYGGVERTRRYQQTDSELNAGVYYPLGDRWTAWTEVNASPTHNVLATFSLLGDIERDFGGGWSGHAGFRYRDYETQAVRMGIFGADKAIKALRVGYTLYASSVSDAGNAVTNRYSGTYNYGDNVFNVTFAHGEDVENIFPAGVLRTNVKLVNVNGLHWFTRSWAASYSLGLHEQGKLYTRQGLSIGVRYRL